MKLEYFRDPAGNFGDDLNPWLWDRLLPGVIDGGADQLLLGVGTILEPWFVAELPAGVPRIVIGSGGGMSVPVMELDKDWHVYAVRGPLTASYLRLDPERAATDPATAIGRYWPAGETGKSSGKVGFMPHHVSLRSWDWRQTCLDAGLVYVDPHGDPLATLEQIAGLKLIVTEAMHGAIVADALRVPWLPVQINPHNYVGKWHDWGASIGMPIHFRPLPYLNDPLHRTTVSQFIGKGLRMAAYQWRRRSSARERDDAVKLLRDYACGNYQTFLSDDAGLARAIGRLDERLDAFRRDWQAGRFS